MSSINNQNLLSPMQTNRSEMSTVPTAAPTPHLTANAFSYNWFVLSEGNTLTGSTAESPASANNTLNPVDNNTPSSGSMESRIERIVQYILPGA